MPRVGSRRTRRYRPPPKKKSGEVFFRKPPRKPTVRKVTRADHGDAVIADAQNRLQDNFSIAAPVDEMVKRSDIAERSFKRRFTNATGMSPISYVQRVRVEDAKQKLERTDEPIDRISWQVGYEDASSFRRLFKRIAGVTPGVYRRKFQVPDIALGRK